MECPSIHTPGSSVAAAVAPWSLPPQHTVHWFRKGLRLHDNPSLRESLVNAATYRCVFVIEPRMANSCNEGVNKWRFLLQCLHDLDDSLRKLGSRLFVVRGQPADVLLKLLQEWGTTCLSFEKDPEPYARRRDTRIINKCRKFGIKCISQVSHTLYNLDEIIESNGGNAPQTYNQFLYVIAGMLPPPLPSPTITVETLNGTITPLCDDHDDKFGVPSLEELGFDTPVLLLPVWNGGEKEALARLDRNIERKEWAVSFGRPNFTTMSLFDNHTGLSPYLSFGCLSTRLLYYHLAEMYLRIKLAQPPLSLFAQILRREFFYCVATRNIHFDQMVGNPICVQIAWEKNDIALARWKNGQTGFPWIDAIIIQLREEGWIHNLARHSLVCFLTRGHLWISWEEGMKVFDELLLDVDRSLNAGVWMWLSCSAFFEQFFHCYCPVRCGQEMDPNGDYIRRYIPALRNMPTCYIHQPWVAPKTVQVAAKSVIGRDYPEPMVNHKQVSQINTERIKLVYTLLAMYKSKVHLSPIAVHSPSETESPPTCIPVIANVIKYNELCSTSHNPRTPSPLITYNAHLTFKRPTLHAAQQVRRHAKYEQKIAMQTSSKSVKKKAIANLAATPRRKIANVTLNAPYNLHQSRSSMPTTTQENTEFKNLAANNFVQTHTEMHSQNVYHEVIPSQPDSELKINRFYLPGNGMIRLKHTPGVFASSSSDYSDSDEKNNGTNNNDADSSYNNENEQCKPHL